MEIYKFADDFVEGKKLERQIKKELGNDFRSIIESMVYTMKPLSIPNVSRVNELIEQTKKFNEERKPCRINCLPSKRYENDLREALGYRRH